MIKAGQLVVCIDCEAANAPVEGYPPAEVEIMQKRAYLARNVVLEDGIFWLELFGVPNNWFEAAHFRQLFWVIQPGPSFYRA